MAREPAKRLDRRARSTKLELNATTCDEPAPRTGLGPKTVKIDVEFPQATDAARTAGSPHQHFAQAAADPAVSEDRSERPERVRVLHVIQTIGIGGMENRILRLARGLDSTVYDVCALSLRPTPGAATDWPASRHRFFPIEPGIHPGRLYALARFMHVGRFRIVHSHNWATMFYGVLAGRLARVPVVLHGEHGANEGDWKGVPRKREVAAGLLARLATRVVAVNDAVGSDIQRRWRLPPSHVVSVPNGVDLSRFRPGPRTREAQRQFVIGTVARFDRIKNLPCIVRGFQLFRKANPDVDARLVLVGDGPLWGEMRALVAGAEHAALIALPGAAADPEAWYARFDVYVNASFSEGMSNTILEGMACGLPVVASDVPGNRCWLEQGVNALFFASDDAGQLASQLACLARDRTLQRRLGDTNRRLAERAFDNRAFVERYHQLYQQLLRG